MDTNGDINATGEEADPMADFPRDAKPWLDLIKDGERCFQTYNDKSDSIDKLYANLAKMAEIKVDREFQIFWANLEVLKPSIYSRQPIPVVVPRFKDMEEITRKASEMLERTLISTFDLQDIDSTMKAVRDDLAVNARGVAWLRYEAQGETADSFHERVCFDHIERKDFLHEPARKWREVGWVARREFLTMEAGRKRFGDAFLGVKLEKHKSVEGEYEGEKKAEVWEIWSKKERAVVWVSPGVLDILDAKEPILNLEGFFPCPRPAYGTLQRGSMIPVPDFLYYRDQIEEINELTARISALCEALRVKGFYAAGQENISSAIESAIKQQDNAAILIPVPSFALMSGQSIKDAIVWLPVDQIAMVVKELILNRKQLIEDVYQITGLSDIMRGETNASETATAQKIKSQYGSVRIRDRQGEMVRIARDMTRIAAEIIAENFQPETLKLMSQVKLPMQAEVEQQMAQMQQQAMAQGQQFQPPKPPIVFEQVVELYRSEHVRPFILDVETDSTIQPDEDAEKQRATEYITAVGGFMQQALPVGQALPQAIPVIGAMLKFSASKFRAGREMEGIIEKFVDQMTELSQAPKPPPPPDPAVIKAQADTQRAQMDMQHSAMKAQADMKLAELNVRLKELDLQIRTVEANGKMAEASRGPDQPPPVDIDKTIAETDKLRAETDQIRAETGMSIMKAPQEVDHAERQMALAEKPEPAGAE